MGQKTMFLVLLPYLLNGLEFSANILTQGRSWVELAPLGCHIHFWLGGSIFGAKNTFFYTSYSSYSSSTTKILLAPYLPNRLELDAHIFTQGRYETLDVPFGGLVDFGLGGSIFGAKNYVFGNKSCTRCISGTAWI